MPKRDISLLPRKDMEGSPIGRIVNWLLSVGRYVVVFTELAVIGAFLSRFWLDRKNSDLSEEIRQERAILESTAEFEKEFRLFQARLKAIAKSLGKEEDVLFYLNSIVESMPRELVLLNYNFSGEGDKRQASVLVSVDSENALAEFVDNLLAQEEVTAVSIGTIEKEQETSGMRIQFLITFSSFQGDNASKGNK